MSKGFSGLHGLSTKTSTMTKVKPKQNVHFMSNLIQQSFDPLDIDWYTWLHIV